LKVINSFAELIKQKIPDLPVSCSSQFVEEEASASVSGYQGDCTASCAIARCIVCTQD
jgi:hypothetical protein